MEKVAPVHFSTIRPLTFGQLVDRPFSHSTLCIRPLGRLMVLTYNNKKKSPMAESIMSKEPNYYNRPNDEKAEKS